MATLYLVLIGGAVGCSPPILGSWYGTVEYCSNQEDPIENREDSTEEFDCDYTEDWFDINLELLAVDVWIDGEITGLASIEDSREDIESLWLEDLDVPWLGEGPTYSKKPITGTWFKSSTFIEVEFEPGFRLYLGDNSHSSSELRYDWFNSTVGKDTYCLVTEGVVSSDSDLDSGSVKVWKCETALTQEEQ